MRHVGLACFEPGDDMPRSRRIDLCASVGWNLFGLSIWLSSQD